MLIGKLDKLHRRAVEYAPQIESIRQIVRAPGIDGWRVALTPLISRSQIARKPISPTLGGMITALSPPCRRQTGTL